MGAVFGGVIGHFFNGSVLPLTLGFACLSLAALVIVLGLERPHGLCRPGGRHGFGG